MLEYEWGNPSTIMYSGDDPTQEPDPNRQLLDPYSSTHTFHEPSAFLSPNNAHFPTSHFHHPEPPSSNHHFHPIYDPMAGYGDPASYGHHHTQTSMLTLEPGGPTGYMVVPKSEPLVGGVDFSGGGGRIGLNLGGRTYFSSAEDDFVSRLYRRSRVIDPGSVNSPRCQAEGCNADLSHAKHYHRRHKVCEFHSKAATVIAAGLTQRFCQQCSRFHLLSEFDNGKRSCRKRLADHNRRRRKSQQQQEQNSSQEHDNKTPRDNASNSPRTNPRSPPDSGAHSSSVTVAFSPPRMSPDCFTQRSYQLGSSSSASGSSLFFSNE